MLDFFPSPLEMIDQVPLTLESKLKRLQFKHEIESIAQGASKKKLLMIGPCSIHNTEGALIYAKHLKNLSEKISDQFITVMRVHIEKPRTKNSWRGFLYDPELNQTGLIEQGILRSRKMMTEIAQLGLPITTEILDPLLIPYFEDLLSFATIGARTVSSAPHRLAFSDLSIPTGFKNRIDGDFESPISAIEIARSKHTILKLHESGRLIKKETSGNYHNFFILRGSDKGPNYDFDSILKAEKMIKSSGLDAKIIIDCAHGNSKERSQELVFSEVIDDHIKFHTNVAGFSFESYLKEGKYLGENLDQAPFDLSITDYCLSFEKTEKIILEAYSKLISSNHSLCLNSAIGSPSNVVRSAL